MLAPRAAMTDSRSGPAVATTKSPGSALSARSTSSALSVRAVSPVMMTAPLRTSCGVAPAARYSASTSARRAGASMRAGASRGVRWTWLRYQTSLAMMVMRGTDHAAARLSMVSRLKTTSVVELPTSMPTLVMTSTIACSRGLTAG